METRSEMARLWLYGNHEISSKVKYYLILRYGTVEQAIEQSVSELEKELAKQFEPVEYQTLLLRKNTNYLDEVYGRFGRASIIIISRLRLWVHAMQIHTVKKRHVSLRGSLRRQESRL